MKELKSLISYSNCTIFILSPEMLASAMDYRPEVDHISVETLLIDNKSCKAISESENQATPAFQKIEDVKFGLKN